MKKLKVVFTNKNYRLLSFKSFFIFFHFYLFSRGLPLAGVFFLGGGERLKILYSRRVFLHSDFFTFFIFTLFHFLDFLHFQIFSLFYIFLQFYNFSEVTPVGVFFFFLGVFFASLEGGYWECFFFIFSRGVGVKGV